MTEIEEVVDILVVGIQLERDLKTPVPIFPSTASASSIPVLLEVLPPLDRATTDDHTWGSNEDNYSPVIFWKNINLNINTELDSIVSCHSLLLL